MTMDDFVYYFLLKKHWEDFQKELDAHIKAKEAAIMGKLEQMNKLAEEIRAELGWK